MKEYCTQNNGDCRTCSLVNYGRDCMNNPISARDYVEFTRGGGCRIIESDISQDRAEQLVPEIEQFNKENSTGTYYRSIME